MRIDVLFALDQKPATFSSALLMATKLTRSFLIPLTIKTHMDTALCKVHRYSSKSLNTRTDYYIPTALILFEAKPLGQLFYNAELIPFSNFAPLELV